MNERIRFGTPVEFPVPFEELPLVPQTAQGDATPDASVQVYIVEDIYKQIWQHVLSSLQVECGGILVGYPFKTFDQSTTFVVVIGAIPQSSSNRGIAHFTVGPEEVAASRASMERTFPGLIAVGWYHSHPGHGVFLSGQDMVIVRSIYNSPWHLALVIDPQHREAAFFAGPDGVRLNNWNVLSHQPEIVHAMALYNQVQAWMRANQVDLAQRLTKQIEFLVNTSPELLHWRLRGGYRDLEPHVEASNHSSEPHTTPLPARRDDDFSFAKLSPFLIFIPTILFGMLMAIIVAFISKPLILLIFGWSIFTSLIASYAAILLVVSRPQDGNSKNNNAPDYKLVGLILLINIWLTWLLCAALLFWISR